MQQQARYGQQRKRSRGTAAEQTKLNGPAVLGKASADLDRHLKGGEKNRRGRRPAAATQGKKQAGTFRKSIKSPQPLLRDDQNGEERKVGQLEGRPAKPPRRHQEPHGEGEMDGVEDALLELRLRERERKMAELRLGGSSLLRPAATDR